MPASFVNARFAVFSATELATVDLSTGTNLGALAPGTTLNEPDVTTADAFGRKAAVMASQDVAVVVYGATADAALITAFTANPPTGGWLYIVNGSKTRADKFKVSVVSAEPWPVVDEEARARVRYQFYADSDTIADYHDVIEGVIILPA